MRSNFGHIKQLAPGKFRVYWSENGRRRSKTVYGSVDDCELFLAHRKIEGGSLVPSGITYGEYWNLAVVPTFKGLAETTVSDYRRIWKKELEPRIGWRKVSETTWRSAQGVLSEVNSASVQLHAYRLWKKIANLAVRDGLLTVNPIDRNIRLKKHEKREKAILSARDLQTLMERAEGFKHVYLIAMECGGGLRHEEACAITRDDVSEKDGLVILGVSKALTTAQGKVVHKDTKTAFSRRLVALGEPFSGIVLRHLEDIPAEVSEQASPATITHNWREWCKRHVMDYIPFGQMRTQFSTMHQQAGSIDSLVSLAMGHSDGTTRGRNYTVNTLPAMMMLARQLSEWFAQDVARFEEKPQVNGTIAN